MTDQKKWRVLVISDTHGDIRAMNRVIGREYPFDALIHCGDSMTALDGALSRRNEYALFAVKGNCDFHYDYASELITVLGGHRLLITHGHRLEVDYSLDRLLYKGAECQADVILFGHTHVPLIAWAGEEGTLVINPGSLTRPRQYPRKATYAILTLEEGKRPSARIMEYGIKF